MIKKLWECLGKYIVVNISTDHIKIQIKKWRPATT